MQLAAIGFATLGLALLTRRARIDRGAGEVRVAWFFQEHVACRVGEVLAVQVVRRGPRRQRDCYQVNLVLGAPSRARVNLGSHENAAEDLRGPEVLWFGRRLAAFLGVPLVDQLEAMAVVGPAELASLFAPDWLAGFHNVKLTETPGSDLQLQPIPQKGAPLVDLWKGWPVHRACAVVKFDRTPGSRPRLFVRLMAGFGLGPLPPAFRKPRPLEDITAVELAADGAAVPGVPEAASQPTCRLRLLLRDASAPILELAPHAYEGWAREIGGRLARFLRVPLEDRIRPEGPHGLEKEGQR
jgi:hypothetical protein